MSASYYSLQQLCMQFDRPQFVEQLKSERSMQFDYVCDPLIYLFSASKMQISGVTDGPTANELYACTILHMFLVSSLVGCASLNFVLSLTGVP